MKVSIGQVWRYPEKGTLYRIDGLPTVRNVKFDESGVGDKWVPGVRYTTINPKDPIGSGDNQEFIRTEENFLLNFEFVS